MDFWSSFMLMTLSDWILMIVAGVIIGYSHLKINSTFKKYSKVFPHHSLSMKGKTIASSILAHNGIHDVIVGRISGKLTDHYDPANKQLNLSESVYEETSIAALSVAAHEAGHAIQHKVGYVPLKIRHGLVPVASVSSNLAIPLFFIGFLFNWNFGMDLGIWAFSAALLFQVVTLPVEFNASKRALVMLRLNGLSDTDICGARKVLNAAALTYVAAMSVTLLHLIRLIFLRNSRRD